MAGTWNSQNKVRPGAYINFTASSAGIVPGDRGIVTFPMSLPWGPMNSVIRITTEDVVRGHEYSLLGLRISDEAATPIREAMKNATTALIYRMGASAAQATGTLCTGVTAKAKYPGTFGNKISVASIAKSDQFQVVTLVNGVEVDRQLLSTIDTFVENGWIVLDGDAGTELDANSGVVLTGGTDGTVVEATEYANYLAAIADMKWHCMAVPSQTEATSTLVVEKIRDLRENEGQKVQAVVCGLSTADYEGIISVDQGYYLGETLVPVTSAACWVAGATAGAGVAESNTYKVVEGATGVYNKRTSAELEEALLEGKLCFSTRQDGAVIVEKDINTLHTFTTSRPYPYSKNRVIRCLDDIGMYVSSTFENSYIGKVDNDDDGRTLFKGDIIDYLNALQEARAIRNFNASTDIEVSPGTDIDSVVCNLWVQPTDAMEKLYMTVTVA